MKKKQLLSVLLISILVLSVFGCNRNSGQSSDISDISGISRSGSTASGSPSADTAGSGDSSVSQPGSSESDSQSIGSMISSLISSLVSSFSSSVPGSSAASSSVTPVPTGGQSNIPNYPVVKEDQQMLSGAVAAWDFTDGGTSGAVKSAISGGAAGTHKWGVWLNDITFGKVLDFSTDGSFFKASGSNVTLGGKFTIAAWVKAPIRENKDRVIISQSSTDSEWKLQIDKDTRKLTFSATGITGNLDSGKTLGDGKWHHVMVTFDGSSFKYYVDGTNIRSISASGAVPSISADIYVGALSGGTKGFDGSVSRVRIYNTVRTPGQVTSIKAPNSKNELAEPILKLKKGLVLDRRQYAGPVPPENEKVYSEDIQNVINMGFDHIKVLLTPNHIINSDGSLNVENMRYITRVVNDVVELNLNCIICLHPEVPFKQTYLTEGPEFEKVIRWYGELADYIGDRWTADQVSIQLMTEPYSNSPEARWSWMSDRMWGAVRNVLPNHTIITSSDRSGNLERLKLMVPATDSNLIYSFTTYEPYTIGFNIARTGMGGNVSFWNYLKDIPYPANETNLNAIKIEDVISLVPDSLKSLARSAMQAYASGTNDGGDTNYTNQYAGTNYNSDWHLKRAKSLDDWRKKYGGNISIMCVEFGCMDSVMGVSTFQGAQGAGLADSTRIRFVKDLRTSFEAYDIGWSYWSYNEPFTVFLPAKRIPGFSPDPNALAPKWYDYDMLETALGLHPLK